MAMTGAEMLRRLPKREKKKGKKVRRFNKPRSLTAKALCAKRKAARREASEAAAKRNAELRNSGLPTPWEISKAMRYAARH